MCFSKNIRIKNSPSKSVASLNIMNNDGIGKCLFDEFNFYNVDLDNAYTCSDFNNKNNFNVTHLNVHSTRAKHSQLIEMLNNLTSKGVNVHALLLCETSMNQLNINHSDIAEYNKYGKFRQNKGGSRVAAYVNTDMQYILRPDFTINCNETSLSHAL